MSNNATASASASGGTGFLGMLTIAFIVLKLCHVIHWSWLWVLSPLWIGAVIGLLMLAIMVIVGLAIIGREDRKAIRQLRKHARRSKGSYPRGRV